MTLYETVEKIVAVAKKIVVYMEDKCLFCGFCFEGLDFKCCDSKLTVTEYSESHSSPAAPLCGCDTADVRSINPCDE